MRVLRLLCTGKNVIKNKIADKFVTFYNGKKMPIVGLSSRNIRDEYNFEQAIALGYRLIDTSYDYGNEEMLGHALKSAEVEGKTYRGFGQPVIRESMFIISKLPRDGHLDFDHFFNESLRKLQLKYLDMYHMQLPLILGPHPDDNRMRKEALVKTWKKMEEMVHLGKINQIGLCNPTLDQIRTIYDISNIKPANVQVECNPWNQKTSILALCKQLNITVTALRPLFSYQFLWGYHSSVLKEAYEMLGYIGRCYDKTPSQIVLRWLIERGMAVLPEEFEFRDLRNNLEIFDFELEEGHKFLIYTMKQPLPIA